ncbi:MAG: hypothetical protein VXW65_04050 [Pseudomonadota bacterium]|nr:hypothetical protein [Pseudomonadota bacterium]
MSMFEQPYDTVFRQPDYPQVMIRAAEPTDNAQLLALVATPMPSAGVLLSLSRQPDYFVAARAAFTHVETWVLVPIDSPCDILAMYALSMRPCYINGKVEMLRYLGDLRVAPSARGQRLLRLMMRHLKQRMPEPYYSQAVVLSDNIKAKQMLHQAKADFVQHYPDRLLYTATMTGSRRPLSDTADQPFSQRTATAEDVSLLNGFVQKMAQYFNFLPRYDFFDLLKGHPYWNGMSIGDFTLVFRARQLVGIFGLWDQHTFKQSKIERYHPLLALLRPLYNVWARANHGLVLPERGQPLSYLMLHSPLCRPDELDVFDFMLRSAFAQTVQRGVPALCYSLAEHDPRRVVQLRHHGRIMSGVHGFYSFGADPQPQFDHSKISYLECGRI